MNRRQLFASLGFAGASASLFPQLQYASQTAPQVRSLNLKITGLKTFVVNVGSVNWVFCKVYTNQGLVGLGEGSITSKEATLAQAIMEHERFLVGKDPTDIELLWHHLRLCRAGCADALLLPEAGKWGHQEPSPGCPREQSPPR